MGNIDSRKGYTQTESNVTMAEHELVKEVGLVKEKGYVYFLNKELDIGRFKAQRVKKGEKRVTEPVTTTDVTREKGYLYFLSKEGHVCRAKMKPRGKKNE